MIEIILIAPLIIALSLLFIRSFVWIRTAPVFYALLHLIASADIFLSVFSERPLSIFFTGFWGELIANNFRPDELNVIYLAVLSGVYVCVAIYTASYIKQDKQERSYKYFSFALILFVFAMTGGILSANLGLSWVFIEATTFASAYLIYFNRTRHSIEAAWKYVFICSIGIALAFVGIIILSAASGEINSLSYEKLYAAASLVNPFWLKLSFVFILIGIGTKMGAAPLHFWLPDAHSEAPSPVSALLSAALLNSAFLIILRVYKILVIAQNAAYAKILLVIMGLLSLFAAAVFIYKNNNYKRILAYSSVENMGLLLIGSALGPSGLFAALIHMAGHSFIKASFFMTAGNILHITGKKRVSEVSGLVGSHCPTGWLWFLSFVGIAALPPSPLFLSEYFIFKALIEKSMFVLLIIIVLMLTIILYGLGRAVVNMSFGPPKKFGEFLPGILMILPQIMLLGLSFAGGMHLPHFIIEIFNKASAGF